MMKESHPDEGVKLQVSKKEKQGITRALAFWKAQNLIDEQKEQELKLSLDDKRFEWNMLARYAFWIALISLVLSVLSLFSDNYIQSLIKRFYQTPNIVFAIGFACISVAFYFFGFRSKHRQPERSFSSETLMLAGACSTAASIGFLGQVLGHHSTHYTFLFLLSIGIYALLAIKLRSQLLWVFMLIALGVWFASETSYRGEDQYRFWGMNYPLRFTFFGIALSVIARSLLPKIKLISSFEHLTFLIGLLYTMVAMWLLSIFGNYSDLSIWSEIRQSRIFYWGILAIVCSLSLVVYGMKKAGAAVRDIGFVFLILNLYTRFFEYLWDSLNKTLFFLLLAASFWFVGRWAERLWKKRA